MNSFERHTQTVMDFLTKNQVSDSSCTLHMKCYSQLGSYLGERGLDYSVDEANSWLEGLSKSRLTKIRYRAAIIRLDDVFKTGKVSFWHRPRITLDGQYESVVSSYLTYASGLYSDEHILNIRNRCRFFFSYLQLERNACPPDQISYEDVIGFYQKALPGLSPADTCMYKGSAMNLLAWMAEQGMCTAGLSMVLKVKSAENMLFLEDLPSESADVIRGMRNSSMLDFPADEFLVAASEFRSDLRSLGYRNTMMATSETVLRLLYIFLDMNRLGYSPLIAHEWFKTASASFGTNFKEARRVLSLFEAFTQEGAVHADKTFFYGKKHCELLPEWCRAPLYAFLEQKKREEKADSTIDMYRSSCTRFCQFLTETGISSFNEMDASSIKAFNRWDRHKTIDGKNAYNVRIRKFLGYLAEQGIVGNRFLAEALPCSAAPKERVVRILSEEEEAALEQYGCEQDHSLFLRDRAIILLGLKMGLRSSDIMSLELSQIDWESGCIRFCQTKTLVEKVLPMSVDVGNALFLYLTKGRPESADRHVFITHKAPYRKITRGVSCKIMKKAFPDKGADRPVFHCTRKTYATGRFRGNCSFSEVADLLGQTGTDTVHKYISLDEDRMRLCPISLGEAGILPMEGGFRYG